MASVFTPMPLRRVRDALDDPRWLYEVKHDGFRGVAHVFSRATGTRSERSTASAPSSSTSSGRKGPSSTERSFGSRRMADRSSTRSSTGAPRRTSTPLTFSRSRRRSPGPPAPRAQGSVRYLSHVRGRGIALFTLVCEQDLEGIVAKPTNRIYGAEPPPVSVKIEKPAYTRARRRHERFEGARQR